MSDLYWLSDTQMERLRPYFPNPHGKPRVDDKRILSGIIFFNRNGLGWRDAPAEYGPHKTLCNRWIRWSRMGVFARIMAGLAAEQADCRTIMIDGEAGGAIGPSRRPNDLKAHRTASSLGVEKGGAGA